MLTKDQTQVMQLFVSRITRTFTIRGVAKLLDKDPSQVHKAIRPLIHKGLIKLTPERWLVLDYKKHHQELSYVEYLRTQTFLERPGNQTMSLFVEDVFKGIKDEYFIMLIFGSAVEKIKPRDVDILVIVDKNVDSTERFLINKANKYSLKFDINVISVESVYEMAKSRDKTNVLNELLNNHLIIYGGESFYWLLKNARR